MYRKKWLEDLVLFEHGPEMRGGFARWVVMPVLKAGHFVGEMLGKRKVRLLLYIY